MNEDNSIDVLLKKALSSTHAPDEELNQITKKRIKEKMVLKKTGKKPVFRLALTTAMLLVVMSGVALAVWHLLSADEYADHLGYPALADSFKSEGAVQINKSVSSGEYNITLLGIVSGKGLKSFEDIDAEKSYAVVAIEKPGSRMPDTSDEDYDEVPFLVSPLVKGLIPWHVNIFSMGGGYTESVIDGVMYRLVECDSSINMFADRGVYLAISSSTFYDNKAFDYDFTSGEITPNPDYDGVNVIFDLPLDKSKADPEKVHRFLEELYGTADYEAEMKRVEEAVKKADEVNNKQDNENINRLIPDEG